MNLYPALKAHMGDWQYYIVKMRMDELASEVDFASDIYEDRTLGDAIQRILNEGRVRKEIVSFLARRNDRFFASIVVAALGGTPKFYPVSITDDERFEVFKDQNVDEAFGILTFSGGQKYYAIDGQHRLKAIKSLIDKDSPDSKRAPKGFEEEEISVLMVVRREENDKAFMTSYRRLFSSLNRHAKPTDQDTNIIMDEDDVFAILTRRLITEHPFFKWPGKQKESARVKTSGKNLKSNEACFTSLQTLYAINETLLSNSSRLNAGWGPSEDELEPTSLFKRFRPEEDYIDMLYEELVLCWDAILIVLPDLREEPTLMRIHNPEADEEDADEKKENGTDHLLFWPIGQELLARVARRLLDRQLDKPNPTKADIAKILAPLGKIDWSLHNPPWRYFLLVYDPNKETWRMRSEDRAESLKVAERIIIWVVGSDPLSETEVRELKFAWEARLAPAQEPKAITEMWAKVMTIADQT